MYLTRNQAYRKVSGVRIPASPPIRSSESSHPPRWLFFVGYSRVGAMVLANCERLVHRHAFFCNFLDAAVPYTLSEFLREIIGKVCKLSMVSRDKPRCSVVR